MSLIHLARQGFITKSALPNVTRQRGTTTGTANLMLYGAGKTHSIGTNTTFTDSSTNNFTVTRNGDTIQATNNPFTGSVYFDGNGDYLSTSISNNIIPTTGNFTFETWIYPTSTSVGNIIAFRGNSSAYAAVRLASENNQLLFFASTSGSSWAISTSFIGSAPINNWHHVAITRNGGTFTLFLNGTSIFTSTAIASGTSLMTGSSNYIGVLDFTAVGGSFIHYFTGYISNFRVISGTALYTANFTPPTSPLTAITNTQLLLLTAQQAPFRDSSTNNFTVTANGNAAGSGLEPFPVNYAGSGYFDGNGDYLSLASNAAFDFGTGDFTIEAWVYLTTGGSFRRIYSLHGSGGTVQVTLRTENTNTIRFFTTTSGIDFTSTTTLPLNSWNHLAVVRNGSAFNLYLNGVSIASATSSAAMPTTSTIPSQISGYDSSNEMWLGYISNLRIIKGTAQYTAAFTPPSAPLTAVTNTQLLLLTNNVGPFVDTSANGFPILRNGDAVQTGFSPFTGQPSAGSGYFDGTGDYLTIPNFSALQLTNSTAFTIECWVYPTNLTGGRFIIENYNQSFPYPGYSVAYNINSTNAVEWWEGGASWVNTGITLTLNEWTHIAVTYEGSGTTRRFFKNGVLSGSAGTVSSSINYTAGACSIGAQEAGTNPWLGYISNLRVIKGAALYTSNFTPATAPLPAVPNTSLLLNTDNYTIANSTPTYLPVTVNGNTTISTAQYPTGMNRSIFFDGNGDYLRISDNAVVELGANDFTIEMFVNFNSLPPSSLTFSFFISKWAGAQGAYNFHLSNVSNLYYLNFDYSTTGNNSFQLSVPWTPSVSTWYHIALVRNSTNLLFFVNGTQQGSTQTISGTINNSNAAFVVGAYLESVNFFHGYMSNLRLTVGSALYTANFTPPAAPLPLSVTVPAFVTNNIYGVYQLA